MNPGLYDRTLTIQSLTVTNEDGSSIDTWANLFSDIPCWVKRDPASETVEADKMEYQQKYVFQIPFPGISHGITGTGKIIFESQDYNIENIQEIGRRVALQITGRANI